MKSKLCITTIFIIYCILFSGCDKSVAPDETILKKGTFKATVTGYYNYTIYGHAVFDNISNGPSRIFFLELGDTTGPRNSNRYVEFKGTEPSVGTHNIYDYTSQNDSSKNIIEAGYSDSESYTYFNSTGGTIQTGIANNNEIKGRADFTAYGFINKGKGQSIKEEIKVTAEFYAEQGNTGIILNKKY